MKFFGCRSLGVVHGVTLRVRVWIEIMDEMTPLPRYDVTLRVRVWIEIVHPPWTVE